MPIQGIKPMTDAFSGCHPVLNFFYFVMVLGLTMFVQHPVFLAISFLGATAYGIWLCGPVKILKVNFLLTLPMLVIVALLNPMFNHYGVTPLLYLESSGNTVTLEAMVYGVVLGCVLFIAILWFACYNKVMTSDKFIYLFGRIIPSISLLLSMALRFVPHFNAQLKVIRNGQKCVGMDVKNGRLRDRARHGLNILSILVTWALENAIETADSMRSRGYGLKGRTAFSIYRFTKRDSALLLWLGGLGAVSLYGCSRGAAFAQYNPRILLAGFSIQGHTAPVSCPVWMSQLTFVCFALFCFTPLLLGIAERVSLMHSAQRAGQEMAMTYRQIYTELDREGEKYEADRRDSGF